MLQSVSLLRLDIMAVVVTAAADDDDDDDDGLMIW